MTRKENTKTQIFRYRTSHHKHTSWADYNNRTENNVSAKQCRSVYTPPTPHPPTTYPPPPNNILFPHPPLTPPPPTPYPRHFSLPLHLPPPPPPHTHNETPTQHYTAETRSERPPHRHRHSECPTLSGAFVGSAYDAVRVERAADGRRKWQAICSAVANCYFYQGPDRPAIAYQQT